MRELVSVSSGFRVANDVTAFRLGLAILVRSAENGLQDESRNSAARSRYSSTAGTAGAHVFYYYYYFFIYLFIFY